MRGDAEWRWCRVICVKCDVRVEMSATPVGVIWCDGATDFDAMRCRRACLCSANVSTCVKVECSLSKGYGIQIPSMSLSPTCPVRRMRVSNTVSLSLFSASSGRCGVVSAVRRGSSEAAMSSAESQDCLGDDQVEDGVTKRRLWETKQMGPTTTLRRCDAAGRVGLGETT